MGGFFSKILKPVGIGLGAAALGSMLFPETTSMLTGGLFGSEAAGGEDAMARIFSTDNLGGSSSIWSNPTVISSGILAGTSLLSGLFGTDAEDAAISLNKEKLAEEKRQFDATMALKEKEMAQAIELAKAQAGGASHAAGIAADANKRIALANLIGQNAQLKSQALQIPLAMRGNQTNAAQTTGAQSGAFFNNLMAGLQRPALGA